MKNLLRHPISQNILVFLISCYVVLIRLTCKVKVEGRQHVDKFWDDEKPVIVGLWHGRLLLTPLLFPRKVGAWRNHVSALISDHPDGKLIAKAAAVFRLKVVHGSSSSGGMRAVREMMGRVRRGHNLLITPDGPRGPRMRLQKGVMEVARLTGLPVVTASISCNHALFVKSWDRFMLPRPFSTVSIQWSEAIIYKDGVDIALKAQQQYELEMRMVAQQVKNDAEIGQTNIINPAPLPKPEQKS